MSSISMSVDREWMTGTTVQKAVDENSALIAGLDCGLDHWTGLLDGLD